MNKIINTLTIGKANLIVTDQLGVIMVKALVTMPAFLQRLNI